MALLMAKQAHLSVGGLVCEGGGGTATVGGCQIVTTLLQEEAGGEVSLLVRVEEAGKGLEHLLEVGSVLETLSAVAVV
jgi:hypothetical protein